MSLQLQLIIRTLPLSRKLVSLNLEKYLKGDLIEVPNKSKIIYHFSDLASE